MNLNRWTLTHGLDAYQGIHAGDWSKTADHAMGDLAHLVDTWNALVDRDNAGKTKPEVTAADAAQLLPAILVGQRRVTQWLMGEVPSVPNWVIEDGHVVVGSVRVPLTINMLEKFMRGEFDGV